MPGSASGLRRCRVNSYDDRVAQRQTTRTRAKDDDRSKTCQILDSALGDGQLSMEEHRTRVAAATTAATLGDLQQLVDDLQTDNAPVQMPNLSKPSPFKPTAGGGGWGIRAAIAGVLVVFGIAVGWGLYGNTPSPLNFTSDPGAKDDGIPAKVITPPTRLHSQGGLDGLLEQMRQRFGDTMGYGLTIYPEYAVLMRPDPNDDRRTLSYYYKGGFDDPNTSATSDSAQLVDLGAIDVKAVIGVLKGAPAAVGIKVADIKQDSTYLTIDPTREPQTPGQLTLRVNISSDFGHGSVAFAPDGTIKHVEPLS
jgi:hypothetical protein